ncbi:hypothetical protein GCM10010358_61060 [Streptomyces minutiscleroticus]|uniref:Uncharacterized protein n=1 Tax=Streptomyces minutiscleroticus TaxID=68238 RepID=A0A918U6R1_9ACTN|nr:hypothetical protein GCM10010358_61060 [Streptomyces minutiscleroticus]
MIEYMAKETPSCPTPRMPSTVGDLRLPHRPAMTATPRDRPVPEGAPAAPNAAHNAHYARRASHGLTPTEEPPALSRWSGLPADLQRPPLRPPSTAARRAAPTTHPRSLRNEEQR